MLYSFLLKTNSSLNLDNLLKFKDELVFLKATNKPKCDVKQAYRDYILSKIVNIGE